MKCFYHNDPDGILAAFWVYYFMGPSVECIPMWYGKEFPIDKVEIGEKVFIVDYSIEPEEMMTLLVLTNNVYWIDHHKTAIDKYENFPREVKGLRVNGYAGCQLTYYYLKAAGAFDSRVQWTDFVGMEPKFCKIIAAMDLRQFQSEEEKERGKAFIKGMFIRDYGVLSDFWIDLMRGKLTVDDVVSSGKILVENDTKRNASKCKRFGFDCMFEGYKCFAINDSIYTDYFDSVDKEAYDIFIGFIFNGEKWKYEMRSGFNSRNQDLDVSEIAAKYGGGGHKNAAGMIIDSLILKKNSAESVNSF